MDREALKLFVVLVQFWIYQIQCVSPGLDSFLEPKRCHSQFNSTATTTTVVVAVCSSPHVINIQNYNFSKHYNYPARISAHNLEASGAQFGFVDMQMERCWKNQKGTTQWHFGGAQGKEASISFSLICNFYSCSWKPHNIQIHPFPHLWLHWVLSWWPWLI